MSRVYDGLGWVRWRLQWGVGLNYKEWPVPNSTLTYLLTCWCVQQLRAMLSKCVEMADRDGARTIAFPTVGCGKLQYTPDDVANCFIEACQQSGSAVTVQLTTVWLTQQYSLRYCRQWCGNCVEAFLDACVAQHAERDICLTISVRPSVRHVAVLYLKRKHVLSNVSTTW